MSGARADHARAAGRFADLSPARTRRHPGGRRRSPCRHFEPHRQRREVLRQRRQGDGRNRSARRPRAGARQRRRPRHPQDRTEAHLQTVSPGARPTGCTRQGDRAGAVHRPFRRQAARRPRLGGKRRTGPRQHLRAATSGGQMTRILVVEDEQHLADGLRFNLEAEGWEVQLVDTGEAALALLEAEPAAFDVVVLDIMLPGIDGFAVMSQLRQSGEFVPTLMLTARGHPEDILRGFSAGADDYLTKPFELAILIARICGLLRRREWLQASLNHTAAAPPSNDAFTFGAKSVQFDLLELRVRDQVFPLTLMEANLLRYLIRYEGRPVSRKAMLEEVWGLHEDTDTRAIDNFIVRLRRYIEDDPTRPRHLLTVRGVGYRFVAAPPAK